MITSSDPPGTTSGVVRRRFDGRSWSRTYDRPVSGPRFQSLGVIREVVFALVDLPPASLAMIGQWTRQTRRAGAAEQRHRVSEERLALAREVHDVVAQLIHRWLIHVSNPDIVVMDIRMPELDGIAALREITTDSALQEVRVLILTTFDIDDYVADALRAGASGFLLKDVDPDELVRAVRVVAAGDALVAPSVLGRLIRSFVSPSAPSPSLDRELSVLTTRERQVVALVAQGLSNEEIAATLTVSHATAPTHLSRAMTKLHARDRAQLVVIAYLLSMPRVMLMISASPAGASTGKTAMQIVAISVGGIIVLATVTGISVFKPWGRIQHRTAPIGAASRFALARTP